MKKSELRKQYNKKRQALSSDTVENLSLKIANRALELPIWDRSTYSLFLSITPKKEVDTEFLLNILQGKDKNVTLSKSDFKTHEMIHYLLTDNTRIAINPLGIPEPSAGFEIKPEKIDVVFIPLLAFDEKGNRIGYGKGFYDRFLAQCRPQTLKIGLSFFRAEKTILPATPTDIALDYCITPERTYDFSKAGE